MNLYPLALKLDGRRVLVVGGGAVATRRMPALLAAGARVDLVSPALTPALRAYVEAGRLTWQERRFVPSDMDGRSAACSAYARTTATPRPPGPRR
jgi:uroporphyrin-III C-methyltransferase/precorrin-2 dehydrogenase/sirohydrochlorin ferrochelatase